MSWCVAQLWEDEQSTADQASPVLDADDRVAANGEADDATIPDDEQPSSRMVADSNGDEVGKYDADAELHESVEDASAGDAIVPDDAEQASSGAAADDDSGEVSKYDAVGMEDATVPADDAGSLVADNNGDEVDKCDNRPQVSLEDGRADDTAMPDGDAQQVSSCLAAGSSSDEVDKCDDGPPESVEVPSELAADESREQECLISLDDDADLSGSAANMDVAECHAEKDDHTEGDTPHDSQHPVEADDVALDNDASIQECGTGEVWQHCLTCVLFVSATCLMSY